ncbi:MAG TPA: acyltransferase domain-containing protein, partial [Caldithrix abyssi]|nr:acyltransferase domain-containing protein [Caldithrix abyssi]
MSDANEGLDIAIIGMAGRFPGAENIEQFWELLKNGVEAVTFFTDEELIEAGVDPKLVKDPNYIKSRAIIKDEDKFDARFFDFFPREVEMMDPQHRLFLEAAWNALEDAGYNPDTYDGLVGLFGGVSLNTYLYSYLMSQKGFISSAEGYQLSIGNDKDFLTTRVSYKLNLTGPSVDVQTACSTSLVAVHLACQNLLNYSCDMALAGGVSITIPQKQGYYYQEGMILSKDGHCRAFDHRASGTISGSGVGMVLLKRLDEALEDGDHIYAVIKGSAYNNDGSNRVGYTAPSVDGQSEVIANAQAVSGVDPETITYIEAHGTGTVMGDPIEIAALTQVFREQTDKKQFCAIGSVKTNIGHLDAAAGVAGLIKTALALHHKQIPPSVNFEKPNPKIDFENSPFFVNTELSDWKTENGIPRRAGISSFGIGGTNVHAILEEAPAVEASDPGKPAQLLMLSAKSPEALDQATGNLANFLKKNPDVSLADVAYTLQVGRKAFNHRRILVANSVSDVAQALGDMDPKRILTTGHQKDPEQPPVAFMFSGQGSQYVNMGKELYRHEPVFREEVDRCCAILKEEMNLDLLPIIYPEEDEQEAAAEKLNQTEYTQPALFVIEYALARLWMHWGVQPAAMVGHSIGEYVAAVIAEVMSLKDGLKIVATRGKLMQSMPPGAMISVQLDENSVKEYLSEQVTIGALNSSGVTVLSGTFEGIEEVEKKLTAKNIQFRRLRTSHAFHSSMMDAILDEFTRAVSQVKLQSPKIGYLSNTSGTWITEQEATNPAYYANHLRNAVRFTDNVYELLQNQNLLLLEVGPGTVLTTLARRHPSNSLGRIILSSMRHPNDETGDFEFLLRTVGRLWMAGVEIDWNHYYGEERRLRVALPTYPFERKRFWLKTGKPVTGGAVSGEESGAIGKNKDISKWFYLPVWKQWQIPFSPDSALNPDHRWLILKDQTGLGNQMIEHLKNGAAKEIVIVEQSSAFEKKSDTHFAIRIDHPEDYAALIRDLKESDRLPDNIVHAFNVLVRNQPTTFDKALKTGYLSLLYLVQALSAERITRHIQVGIFSNDMFNITGYERIEPALATIHGLSKVVAQEFPNLVCRDIDVSLPHTMGNELSELAKR